MELHGQPTDPYRIFFPLGIVLGVMGVAIWPLYYFGVTANYSGRVHAFVQTDGFLYAFIAGFLLTAIPRFTGTDSPSLRTQYVLAAMLLLCAFAFELWAFPVGNALFVAIHATVATLVIRRFRRRKHDPPETFSLIGLGMMAGALAAVVDFGVASSAIPPSLDLLGRRLLSEGMVLLLVLGVGGFLDPRLLGFAALPKFDTVEDARSTKNILFYKAAGITVLLSIVAEYGFGLSTMAFLRAAAVTAVILTTVRPWRLPAVRTTLAWWVGRHTG